MLDDLGQREEAEGLYRQAIVIGEKLAADFSAAPAYRRELAGSHNSLGALLSDLGKYEQAELAHRGALEIRAKLADDFPAEPEYRRDLAQSHSNLGSLLADLRKGEKADDVLVEAFAVAREGMDRAVGIRNIFDPKHSFDPSRLPAVNSAEDSGPHRRSTPARLLEWRNKRHNDKTYP